MYGHADASAVRRAVRPAATSRPLAWLSAQILPRVDRATYRSTRGRFVFSAWLSGLPVVLLTTTGARTGRPRTTPVLAKPDGDALVLIAANFDRPQHLAWYLNGGHPGSRAAPRSGCAGWR